MPTSPGPSAIELAMNDSIAVFTSPFTQVQQVQQFPGADYWEATVTLPAMTRAGAASWEGFFAELRGKLNVMQLGDPRAQSPLGSASGTPVVSTADAGNLPMTTTLATRGWTDSTSGLLLAGDYLQVGYRLYRVCEAVSSDAQGNANISVWPALRETPPDATAITLDNPTGLFRLATNKRASNWSPSQLTTISFQVIEAR